VLSVLHWYGFWIGGLHPWDECSYALRARYAIRGFWLDQMPYCYGYEGLGGFYSGAHPPFLVWCMAISMKLFGVSTFAVRLPSVMLGTATIWLLFLWGREAWGRSAGLWAALIISSLYFYATYARRGQFDAVVAFFILTTLFCGPNVGWLCCIENVPALPGPGGRETALPLHNFFHQFGCGRKR